MLANQPEAQTIKIDFDKFLVYVDRRFQQICGLSIHDVEDFAFYDYYPGEEAKQIEYAQAVRDCASACLENAAGVSMPKNKTCVECGRKFDLYNETDAEEWEYGHDCEVFEGPTIIV